MKRHPPLIALVLLFAVLAAPLWAATAPAAKPASDKSPAGPFAAAISTVTGIAISPLLGTGAYGAWQYFKTDKEARPRLPWYAQVSFWLPALLIVGACAAKDSLGAVLPPGWKKPLDVLETIENKASGLVAAGAVVPFTMIALSKMVAGSGTAAGPLLEPTGLATIHVAAIDWSWLLSILTIPFGVAMFAVVWMASHAINALILLSPWGAIDAALKGARTALLGLLTASSMINPWVGALLSVVVIIVAYLVAGWSFRLTVFGAVFSWDFLTGRKRRFRPDPRENKLFSGTQLTRAGVPVRTWGRLLNQPENGRLVFAYRPWLVLPERRVDVVLAEAWIGRGLFFSTVRDGDRTALILPPRFRTHEEELAKAHGIEGGVREAGLLKAWGSLRELFAGSATRAQVG